MFYWQNWLQPSRSKEENGPRGSFASPEEPYLFKWFFNSQNYGSISELSQGLTPILHGYEKNWKGFPYENEWAGRRARNARDCGLTSSSRHGIRKVKAFRKLHFLRFHFLKMFFHTSYCTYKTLNTMPCISNPQLKKQSQRHGRDKVIIPVYYVQRTLTSVKAVTGFNADSGGWAANPCRCSVRWWVF